MTDKVLNSVIAIRERERSRAGERWIEWQLTSHRSIVSRHKSQTAADVAAEALRRDWQRVLQKQQTPDTSIIEFPLDREGMIDDEQVTEL
jgi:hypothetical protein